MRAISFVIATAALVFAMPATGVWADGPKVVDIRRAAPSDAFIAVYSRHNPARDYQRAYYEDAWKTFQSERIFERIVEIATSRIPEDKLASAKSHWEELRTALEPIHVHSLCSADEMVFAEVMQPPFNQLLFAARLQPTDAEDFERGAQQFCELMGRWSNGKSSDAGEQRKIVTTETTKVQDATMIALTLPKQSPYQPAFARLGDIVLLSTDVGLLRHALDQLQSDAGQGKFDDPRLQAALTHLPKPDDALIFFDGRLLFERLHGVGDLIRGEAHNDEKALQIARLLDRVIDEVSIVDYEVTIGYTKDEQNRTVTLGKLADNYESKLLGNLVSRKPLENWQSWIPKDATAYSVKAGMNCSALYNGVLKIVREEVPDSQKALDKWAAIQQKIGVDIDRDILQSFTGEAVVVTLPIKTADGSIHQERVKIAKCENPEKIRELIGRGIDALNKIPAVQMQQLKLEDCEGLAGFQQLHAAILQLFGASPVIGFRDGWMMIATSRAAVEKVLAVRDDKAESIDEAASFKAMGLDPKGLYRVSYEDVGAQVRHVADVIDKVGAMAPMFLGMAATKAQPEELKPLEEAVGLLPSIAKVVRKFDFFGHSLCVTRAGTEPGTYVRESVVEVPRGKGT